MKVDDFLENTILEKSKAKLSEQQVKNLSQIVKLSKDFHKDAKIPKPRYKVDEGVIVIESGHQPNFLPYSGVWRKVFLLDYLRIRLEGLGKSSIPIFGFFDFDLSTSKWLFQNKVPAINKNGFVSIGLKRASGRDIWKRFNSIEKPPLETWEKRISRIRNIYKKNETNNIEILIEEMWTSYELGDKISDINAILFARLCTRLGLTPLFFRYSDVQQAGLFADEWGRLLMHLEEFNRTHNEVIKNRTLNNIAPVDLNSAPFWYHCECGGKVQLYLHHGSFIGSCPVCGRKHKIDDVMGDFRNLSPKAVMRNIVFSEGLGTSLFVSGSGGGLKYGLISREIARRLGFQNPLTLAWVGKDYYVGMIHRQIINEITRNLDIVETDLYEYNSAASKLAIKRQELAKAIDKSGEDTQKYYVGKYIYSDTLLHIAYNAFNVTPSIIDVLIAVGFDGIIDAWKKAITQAKIIINEFYIINGDIIYGDKDFRALYETVKILKEQSRKIDPLGTLGG